MIKIFDSIEFKLIDSTQIQCDKMQIICTFINDNFQFTIKLRYVNIYKH